MIHYIIVFFTLLVLIWLSSRKSLWEPYQDYRLSVFLCLSLLGFMSAFKATTVGNDTVEYVRLFRMGEGALAASTRYEIGYLYFSFTIWKLFHNVQFLFLLFSVVFYLSLGRFISKYSAMPWVSILIFFAYTLFGFSMSALRQSLAVAILFVSFDFALKRKYINFAFAIAAASLFHTSALFFILMPFLLELKPTRKTFFLFVGVTCILYILFGILLDVLFGYFTYYSNYQNGIYFKGGMRIASIFQLLLSLLFLYIGNLSYKGIVEEEESYEKQLLGHFLVIQMAVVSLSILCLKVNLLDRVVLYYSNFVMLLIPNSLALMPDEKRKFWGKVVLVAVFLYSLIILMFRPEWNSVFPYSFCWNE